MSLNVKETLVLSKIRENPYISQKDLAEEVDLSRSSVANIISGLVQKGFLAGRAYVINDSKPIICIGSFNVDRFFRLQTEINPHLINEVKTKAGAGGVARNVAENLGKLNVPTSILSMVGHDSSWEAIRAESQPYMNLKRVEVLETASTSNFTEIRDKDDEIVFSMADRNIYERMTPAWLSGNQAYLEKAEMIVVDTNVPKDTINQLISFCERKHIPLILMVVSLATLKNIPTSLDSVNLVIASHQETSKHFGLSEELSNQTLLDGLRSWRELGAQTVFVSTKHGLVAYADDQNKKEMMFKHKNQHAGVNHWGLNEALCGGWLYAKHKGHTSEESRWYALANAEATGMKSYTVRPDLSERLLIQEVATYKEHYKNKQSQL